MQTISHLKFITDKIQLLLFLPAVDIAMSTWSGKDYLIKRSDWLALLIHLYIVEVGTQDTLALISDGEEAYDLSYN